LPQLASTIKLKKAKKVVKKLSKSCKSQKVVKKFTPSDWPVYLPDRSPSNLHISGVRTIHIEIKKCILEKIVPGKRHI
jgi:hypothetical protein